MEKSLSKKEYEIMSELAFKKIKSITLAEAAHVLGMESAYLKVLFHRLVKKNWLERLEKGAYLVVPMEGRYGWSEHPFVIASRLLKEYYISYRTALAHHGLTEQLPQTIYTATMDRKNNIEIMLHENLYRFVRINKNKFFGFQTITIENEKVQIATPEKAVVDCLDKEQYAGTIIETAKALRHTSLQFEFLINHAMRMQNASLIRRLGYLLDFFELDSSGLEKHIGKHRNVFLSLVLPRQEIKIDKKWKLIVNVRDEDFKEW